RAKHSMPPSDKREIQRQLLKQLVDRRRRSFQGPLALELNLATTERTPTHSRHTAKNLLDLFGGTLPGVPTRRRSLLYRQGSQIHALVVTCRQGERVPMISSVARPLGSLFADLDLVMQLDELHGDEDQRWERSHDLNHAIEQVRDIQQDEAVTRNLFGDQGFQT